MKKKTKQLYNAKGCTKEVQEKKFRFLNNHERVLCSCDSTIVIFQDIVLCKVTLVYVFQTN